MPEVRIHEEPAGDFCGSEDPRWLFRASNYTMGDILPEVTALLGPPENIGGWLACHDCVRYVQRADWNGLARRVTSGGGINPTMRAAIGAIDPEIIADGLKRMWRQFAEHRVGSALEWRRP